MAQFDMSGLDDVINQMRRLGEDAGPVAEEMLNVGADEVTKAWKEAAEAHGLRDTGAMIESIGYSGPVENIGGALTRDIYPQGNHPKTGKGGRTIRNAALAFILHYGTSHIPATYWVDDADKRCDGRVVEKMRAVWEKFLKSKS